MNRFVITAFAFFALAVPAARADDVKWKKHDINPRSPFEAAGALDVDGDGTLDVVCGDTWYKGPDFKATAKVREVAKVGTYYNDFSVLPMDVNGDGRPDFVTCSYFGKDVGWVENPGPAGGTWAYHEIDKPGPIEAAVAVDLTGDGRPEVLPNSVNTVTFYELVAAGPEPVWKKYDLGKAGAGHGVGSGDVNGDGRTDILAPKGWYEAPANPRTDPWTFHPDWNLGATGIQTTGRDVDGDGLVDVLWGMGHNYGLFWKRGEKGPDGRVTWGETTPIDKTLSSVHTQMWADLDGDGREELVTGKRVYAHEVEPGDVEASVVASYTFDKGKGAWARQIIYQGQEAKPPGREGRDAQKDFPPGTAGTGLEMKAIDIDRDGDLDLLCPGKSGLYLFENRTQSK